MLQTCHKALAGSGLGRELLHTRPADILASNWLCGKTAAFDLSVTSPLNPSLLSEAGLTAGSAAVAAELRKHSANDAKSSELGWTCMHSHCGGVIWSLGQGSCPSFLKSCFPRTPCHKDQHRQVQGGLQLVWPPEPNTSAGQCPVAPLKGWIYRPGR